MNVFFQILQINPHQSQRCTELKTNENISAPTVRNRKIITQCRKQPGNCPTLTALSAVRQQNKCNTSRTSGHIRDRHLPESARRGGRCNCTRTTNKSGVAVGCERIFRAAHDSPAKIGRLAGSIPGGRCLRGSRLPAFAFPSLNFTSYEM